ncbi:ABC transporter substrate-binding protein [Rubellicoccus peritrichatus]|uniref:ABC transporter substrate-binding protein n=1 Tax=Rubellicoccus peritrichatus TaxID=3080537 RepID=A0AAQ3L9W9_9BACT|nr:ABC transporter substrate-binding protein [Puniceicoccus sp. CR14]WOO40030.1 ABC transporter substrate-binding protein [Puniceicoccus sp. CR14]
MKTQSILILAFIFVIVGGCSNRDDQNIPGNKEKVIVQLDWVPEPEHGGLYQALAKGYFADAGLDVTLLPGGANIAVIESVAVGQADVGQSASTQVITAASRDLPIKNIASVFHQIPTALMLHEDNPIDSFSELDKKTIMARPEALYIPFIKEKYGIDFDVIPQNFGLGMLINDPKFIQEGFYIAEPFFAEKEGVKLKFLRLSEAGYEVYATLFANDNFLESRPEVAAAFVDAFIKGWADYLEGDPTPAHEAIKAARNGEVDDDFLNFSREMIITENLGRGNPKKNETYGSINKSRLANEIKMLEALGAIESGSVSVEEILYE